MPVSKNNAEHYMWGAICDGWHLVKNSEFSVIQERMPPGTSEVRHFHTRSRQFFFVLTGTATLEIAGHPEALNAHESAEVPPGTPHQMFNESEEAIEFIVVSIPPSHGDRVEITEAVDSTKVA